MDLNAEIEEAQQQQHFHVLAVDDSQSDRKFLERLLTFSSYQVTSVDSGNKALEYLGLLDNTDINHSTTFSSSSSQHEVHGSKVNLIMTDYSMPGMTGYDLLKRVKGSSWKDVPVVVMSSENEPSRINMCLEGGAKEFLLKPVQLSDLRKLQSHLLKPLIDHSCENTENNFIVSENNNNNNNNNDDDNKIINNVNKRKTISPESSERRSKMKELAVV